MQRTHLVALLSGIAFLPAMMMFAFAIAAWSKGHSFKQAFVVYSPLEIAILGCFGGATAGTALAVNLGLQMASQKDAED